jgi:hypothetical protein
MKKICLIFVPLLIGCQCTWAQTQWITTGNDMNNTPGFTGIGTYNTRAVLTVGGNHSSTEWGPTGINFQTPPAMYTDTSSSGTVGMIATNVLGIPTLVAAAATIFSNIPNRKPVS